MTQSLLLYLPSKYFNNELVENSLEAVQCENSAQNQSTVPLKCSFKISRLHSKQIEQLSSQTNWLMTSSVPIQ